MTTTTTRKLNSTKPNSAPYYLREKSRECSKFRVTVNSPESIKFIAEVRHAGKSILKTLKN